MLLIVPSRCYLPSADTPFDKHAAGARAQAFKVHEEEGSLLEQYRALLQYAVHLAAFVRVRGVLEYRHVSLFVWQISGAASAEGGCAAPDPPPVVFLNVVHPVVEFAVALYSLMNMSFYLALMCGRQAGDEEPGPEEFREELEHWLDLLSYGQLLVRLYHLFDQTRWFAKAKSYLPRPAVEALYAFALARVHHSAANEATDPSGKLQLLAYASQVAAGGTRALELLDDARKRFALRNTDLQPLLQMEQAKLLLNVCLTVTAAEEVRAWHEFGTVGLREEWLTAEVKWREDVYLDVLCLAAWYLGVLGREYGGAAAVMCGELQPLVRRGAERLKQLSVELRLSIHANYACLTDSTQLPVELETFIVQRQPSGIRALLRNLHQALTKNPYVGAHQRMPSVVARARVLMTQGLGVVTK